uniref:50S ribosomal protein L35 n=1 Tax=Romanomermis culicivorax TaxID=13658 RepID=A0A915KI40_ROMCU
MLKGFLDGTRAVPPLANVRVGCCFHHYSRNRSTKRKKIKFSGIAGHAMRQTRTGAKVRHSLDAKVRRGAKNSSRLHVSGNVADYGSM